MKQNSCIFKFTNIIKKSKYIKEENILQKLSLPLMVQCLKSKQNTCV